MSFAVNMYSVPYAASYADAVALFERAKPWRNGGADRPLPNKRTRDMGVRMNGNDVVFRYHRTDVIRWRPDGSYEIDTGGYRSRSTCEFASHFMPSRHWLTKEAAHLRIGDWVYPIIGTVVTVSETGAVSGPGLGRFEKTAINRKVAKELLTEVGYYPYLAWHKLMYPMVQDSIPEMWRRAWLAACDVAPLLHDEAKWHDLMMSRLGDPKVLRKAIYDYRGRAFGIYNYTHHDRVENTNGYYVVSRGV